MKIKFKRFNELKIGDINFDFHIHTNKTDGDDTPEDMILWAKKINMQKIAFTEHVNESTDWYEEFYAHLGKIRKNAGIGVMIGIEVKPIDMMGNLSASSKIINKAEIVVGSVHRYPRENGSPMPLEEIPSLGEKKAAEIEFNLALSLLRNEDVDILGHPLGVYSRYFKTFPKEYFKTLFKESLKNKKAIEINTKYFFEKEFFNLLKEINPYISLGSDAHSKVEIARSFNKIMGEIEK